MLFNKCERRNDQTICISENTPEKYEYCLNIALNKSDVKQVSIMGSSLRILCVLGCWGCGWEWYTHLFCL